MWFWLITIMMTECLITPTLGSSRTSTKEGKETEEWKRNWMDKQNWQQDHYILSSRNILTCPEWTNFSSKPKKNHKKENTKNYKMEKDIKRNKKENTKKKIKTKTKCWMAGHQRAHENSKKKTQ